MVLILPPIERTWADSKAFIVRMEWSQIQSTVRGATADDCAVVFPDRLVHIERRNQQLPSVQASLQVYEFTLTEDQIASLRNILGDPALAGLPSFAPFGLPGSVIVREATRSGRRLHHPMQKTQRGRHCKTNSRSRRRHFSLCFIGSAFWFRSQMSALGLQSRISAQRPVTQTENHSNQTAAQTQCWTRLNCGHMACGV